MLGIQQVTKKKSETCFGTCAVFTGWAKIEEKSSRHLPDALFLYPPSSYTNRRGCEEGKKK